LLAISLYVLGGAIATVEGFERAAAIPHVLIVGPGKARTRPSMAAADAKDGDVVEIAAGTYAGDAAVWTANNLTIRAVGGRALLNANGASAEGKAIWVIKGANTTVENIEFSEAQVPLLTETRMRYSLNER